MFAGSSLDSWWDGSCSGAFAHALCRIFERTVSSTAFGNCISSISGSSTFISCFGTGRPRHVLTASCSFTATAGLWSGSPGNLWPGIHYTGSFRQVKAPPQTYHLQAPTCSMSAASASSMTTVSAKRGLSSTSTMHPDVAYSRECQMLPSQHVIAQGLLGQPSVALRAAAVSSTSGTPSAQAMRVQLYVAQCSGAQGSCPQLPQILSSSKPHACRAVHSFCTSDRAATPNRQETHTESLPTAGLSCRHLHP